MKRLGKLTSRLSLQAEESNRDFQQFTTTGTTFSSVGSQSLAAATVLTSNSTETLAKINSGFVSLALDYDGKYIGDFLLRREGSSLYGTNDTWHNFDRATAAWLISRETWWPKSLSALTLAKLRFSYGTSGDEPDFQDRFGAVTVTPIGFVRGRLGNDSLGPELKTESEMGADFIWKDRISASFTYSKQLLTNALFEVEAPNASGFNTYEKNTGRSHGDAEEMSLEGQVLQKGAFRWRMNLNFDRSASIVDNYGRSCYNETPQYIRVCNGVPIHSVLGRSDDDKQCQKTATSFARHNSRRVGRSTTTGSSCRWASETRRMRESQNTSGERRSRSTGSTITGAFPSLSGATVRTHWSMRQLGHGNRRSISDGATISHTRTGRSMCCLAAPSAATSTMDPTSGCSRICKPRTCR